MKKRDMFLITTTAIVTSAVFIVYLLLSAKGPTVSLLKSGRISWEEAQKKSDEYLHFKPLLVRHRGQSGTDTEKKEPLKGFVFEASDLYEIIKDNHSSLGKDADSVIFLFGQDGTFYSGISKHANMHMIAIGIKGDALMIDGTRSALDSSKALAPSIFDKADPCPPYCPKTL